MTSQNQLLYWRKKRGLSLTKVSTQFQLDGNYVSPNTINRWEKGETALPQWAIPILAKILKTTERELLTEPIEVHSSTSLQLSSAFTGLDIEIAEQVIQMGYSSWIASRPGEAQQAVEKILPWLEISQRRTPLSGQIKQSQHILSRGYELLGILAMDRAENDTAIVQIRRALAISEELQDDNLIAAHITELGEAYRRKGNKDTAIHLMNEALNRTSHIEQATKGYVLEMLAYSYSDINDENAFRHTIEDAMNLLGHSGEGNGTSQRDFIPFEVLEIYGKALRDFGHPAEAIQYLNQAEEALKAYPYTPRWLAALTISKAQAYCDANELGKGISLAIEGITLASVCQSPRQMNRVRKLLIKLEKSNLRDLPILATLRQVVDTIYRESTNHIIQYPQHGM